MHKSFGNSMPRHTPVSRVVNLTQRKWASGCWPVNSSPGFAQKVVGLEGCMDHLVLKARFEEAKNKELATTRTTTTPQKKSGPPTSTSSSTSTPNKSSRQVPKTDTADTASSKANGNSRKCYNCGMGRYLARVCPYPKSSRRESEAAGRPVSVVSVDEGKQRIKELRRKLQEAELAEAVYSGGYTQCDTNTREQ